MSTNKDILDDFESLKQQQLKLFYSSNTSNTGNSNSLNTNSKKESNLNSSSKKQELKIVSHLLLY